ncbi:UNVERIFIED_CONTAM: hypothetical protein K2H54_016539 [Gekko kuhli]
METHWGYQSGAGSPYAYPGMGANGAGIQSSTHYNEDLLHKLYKLKKLIYCKDLAGLLKYTKSKRKEEIRAAAHG